MRSVKTETSFADSPFSAGTYSREQEIIFENYINETLVLKSAWQNGKSDEEIQQFLRGTEGETGRIPTSM